ncbi:MAG: hypothetical protein ACLP8S_07910 [Solirubrobacteraceae bacterium]
MIRTFARHRNRSSRRLRPAVLGLLALLVGGALLAGCGSSSKPAYCAPLSKVENAIKSLPSVNEVTKNGVGTLKTAVLQLQQNATAAVNQAQSDFASQTTALKTSVEALTNTLQEIAATPSLQTLAQLPAELSAVGTAAKNLQSAASSKCG